MNDTYLLTEFIKMTKDDTTVKPIELYGTVTARNGDYYVKMDGSDILTPVTTTTDLGDGERVTISIKNHRATVTGNISNPSAGGNRVDDVEDRVDDVEDSVGTVNYIYNSSDFINTKYWSDNVTITDKDLICSGMSINSTDVILEPDTTYIYSATIKLPKDFIMTEDNLLKIIKNGGV